MNRKSLFYSPLFWILCIALLLLALWVFFGSSIIAPEGSSSEPIMKLPMNINFQKRDIVEYVNKAVSDAAKQGQLPAGAAFIDRYRDEIIRVIAPTNTNSFNNSDGNIGANGNSYINDSKQNQPKSTKPKPLFIPTAPGQGGLVPLNGACSKGELICKQTVERLYNVEFIRVRPPWLLNPRTGEPLELDVYHDGLKIAIEYNGEQHYNQDHPFHKGNKQNFYDMVYRDQVKKEMCAELGIHLTIVSYKVPHIKIPTYLRQRLPRR